MKRSPKALRRRSTMTQHSCQHCGNRYGAKQSTAADAPHVFCRRVCELRWIVAEVVRGLAADRSDARLSA